MFQKVCTVVLIRIYLHGKKIKNCKMGRIYTGPTQPHSHVIPLSPLSLSLSRPLSLFPLLLSLSHTLSLSPPHFISYSQRLLFTGIVLASLSDQFSEIVTQSSFRISRGGTVQAGSVGRLRTRENPYFLVASGSWRKSF